MVRTHKLIFLDNFPSVKAVEKITTSRIQENDYCNCKMERRAVSLR